MTADWRCYIAETITGMVIADVFPAAAPSFTRKLNDKGAWSVPCQLGTSANADVDLHTYVQPGRYTWIIACNDYIVQAGPVWTYQISEDQRTLTVAGTGIQGIFDRRVTRNGWFGTGPITDESQDLKYTGNTLRGIMADLVVDNFHQPYCALPINVPEAYVQEPGEHERSYLGYELKSLWGNMTDLMNVDQGPEVDFAPVFSASGSYVSWEMRIGNPLLGDQGTLITWDYGRHLTTIDVDVNGSAAPVTRVWVKGNGSERAMLSGFAEDTSLAQLGYPSVDYVDSNHTSVTEQETLDQWARADLASYSWPLESWKCSVVIDPLDMPPGAEEISALGQWTLGDAPQIFVDSHPWLAPGAYRRRIAGYQQDTPSSVALDLTQTAQGSVTP